VRNFELATYVAGPHAQLGHLDDAAARQVGQWAPIDKVAAQLVHLAVRLLLLMVVHMMVVVVVVFKHGWPLNLLFFLN